jgi:HEAT repeat protein
MVRPGEPPIRPARDDGGAPRRGVVSVPLLLLVLLVAQGVFLLGIVVLFLVRRDRAAYHAESAAVVASHVSVLTRSRRWWRRAAAARRLAADATPGARASLRVLLEDPHPAVQAAATTSLARRLDRDDVTYFLDRLADRPMAIRLHQHRALMDALPLTTPALLERLTADVSPRRLKSWIALAEAIGSAELLERVGTLHNHPDALIRLSVARALRKLAQPLAEEVLLISLRDPDWRVRAVAARSLGVLDNSAAVPRLAAGMHDVRWWVRFRSGLALAQLGEDGRGALADAQHGTDRYAGEMATMIDGLSADSISELSAG